MDLGATVRQLFVHLCLGTGPEVLQRMTALTPAERSSGEKSPVDPFCGLLAARF